MPKRKSQSSETPSSEPPAAKRSRSTAKSLLARLRAAAPPTPIPVSASPPSYSTGPHRSPPTSGYTTPTSLLSLAVFEDPSSELPEIFPSTQAATSLSESPPSVECGAKYPAFLQYLQDAPRPVFSITGSNCASPILPQGSREVPSSAAGTPLGRLLEAYSDNSPSRKLSRSDEGSDVSEHSSDTEQKTIIDLTDSNGPPIMYTIISRRDIERNLVRVQKLQGWLRKYTAAITRGERPGSRRPTRFTLTDVDGLPVFYGQRDPSIHVYRRWACNSNPDALTQGY